LLDTIRLNDNHNDGSSGTHEKSPSAANRNNNNDNSWPGYRSRA
jgi:hypothetical protein